jgi:DNA-binding helix-hairpin-helix protein with protein kinase domain
MHLLRHYQYLTEIWIISICCYITSFKTKEIWLFAFVARVPTGTKKFELNAFVASAQRHHQWNLSTCPWCVLTSIGTKEIWTISTWCVYAVITKIWVIAFIVIPARLPMKFDMHLLRYSSTIPIKFALLALLHFYQHFDQNLSW